MSRTIPTKATLLERMLRLTNNLGTTGSAPSGPTTMVEHTAVGVDGNTYAVIREGHRYFLKVAAGSQGAETPMEAFDYINGFNNRLQESSEHREQLIRRLDGRLALLREESRVRMRPGTDIRRLVERLERVNENRGAFLTDGTGIDPNAQKQAELLAQLNAAPPSTAPAAPVADPAMPPLSEPAAAPPVDMAPMGEPVAPTPDSAAAPVDATAGAQPPVEGAPQGDVPGMALDTTAGVNPAAGGGDPMGGGDPAAAGADIAPTADAPVPGAEGAPGGEGEPGAEGAEPANNEVQSLLGELGQLVGQMRDMTPQLAKTIVNSSITMAEKGLRQMPDTEVAELANRIRNRGEKQKDKLDEDTLAPEAPKDFSGFAESMEFDLTKPDDVSRAIMGWAENWTGRTEDADVEGVKPYLTPEVRDQIGGIISPEFLGLFPSDSEDATQPLQENDSSFFAKLVAQAVTEARSYYQGEG